MRTLLFLSLFAIAGGFVFKWWVQSGEMDAYLDSHPNPAVNSQIEYYWGITLELAGRGDSARYRFKRISQKYPETDYGALAAAELINIAYEAGDRDTVVVEGQKFIEQYPDNPKVELIRKRVMNFQ